jgi:hypothetical protein
MKNRGQCERKWLWPILKYLRIFLEGQKEIRERTVGDCMFFKTSSTNITLTLKEES